jgi:hypothetical protein
MSTLDKYLVLADEYSKNFEDLESEENFAKFKGLVRGTSVTADNIKFAHSEVPGQLPATAFVGNVGLSIKRTLLSGNPIQANLGVIIGVSFSFSDFYNFLIKRLSNIQVNVYSNYYNNSIEYFYEQNANIERIEVTGGSNYNIFSILQGLYNVRATANKVRLSLPFEENSRLNNWQRDGIAIIKQTWLSNIEKQPITVSRAPGQFNKSIYDSNIPVTFSNTEGLLIFVPSLAETARVGDSETTDVTLYFSKLQRI